jgi:hypothetical protein
MNKNNISQKKERLPRWAWSLYGHASPKRSVRWVYRSLWWCASTSSGVFRLVTILALIFTFCSLLIVFVRNWQAPSQHTFILVAELVALFLLVKGCLAQIAPLLFGENTLVSGRTYVNSLDYLVPRKAQKVAFVGQNLASRLSDETYVIFSQSLKNLLSRGSRSGKTSIEKIWIVFQTPDSLKKIHPLAAKHLRTISLPAIEKLQSDLKEYSERVYFGFHPAATLSMLVVNWGLAEPLAVVTPKLQITSTVQGRLSFIARGKDYVAVTQDFERFIFHIEQEDYPKATWASLADAKNKLQKLLEDADL